MSSPKDSNPEPFEILWRDPGPEVEAVQAEMLAAAHQISQASQRLVACFRKLPPPSRELISGDHSPTIPYALQEAMNHACLHHLSPAVACLLDAVRATPESLEREHGRWKASPGESRGRFRIGGVGADR